MVGKISCQNYYLPKGGPRNLFLGLNKRKRQNWNLNISLMCPFSNHLLFKIYFHIQNLFPLYALRNIQLWGPKTETKDFEWNIRQ